MISVETSPQRVTTISQEKPACDVEKLVSQILELDGADMDKASLSEQPVSYNKENLSNNLVL